MVPAATRSRRSQWTSRSRRSLPLPALLPVPRATAKWMGTVRSYCAAGRNSHEARQNLCRKLLLHAQRRDCFYHPLKSHSSLPRRSRQHKHHLPLRWVTSTCEHGNERAFLKQLNPGPCTRALGPAPSLQTCKESGRNTFQDPWLCMHHLIPPLLLACQSTQQSWVDFT